MLNQYTTSTSPIVVISAWAISIQLRISLSTQLMVVGSFSFDLQPMFRYRWIVNLASAKRSMLNQCTTPTPSTVVIWAWAISIQMRMSQSACLMFVSSCFTRYLADVSLLAYCHFNQLLRGPCLINTPPHFLLLLWFELEQLRAISIQLWMSQTTQLMFVGSLSSDLQPIYWSWSKVTLTSSEGSMPNQCTSLTSNFEMFSCCLSLSNLNLIANESNNVSCCS